MKTPVAVQLLLPEMGGITGFYEARTDRVPPFLAAALVSAGEQARIASAAPADRPANTRRTYVGPGFTFCEIMSGTSMAQSTCYSSVLIEVFHQTPISFLQLLVAVLLMRLVLLAYPFTGWC